MRWETIVAFIAFGVICSVIRMVSGEQGLEIISRSSAFNVGEKKALYCQATDIEERPEWIDPKGKTVLVGRNFKSRVFVEQKPNIVALMLQPTDLEDNGVWTCKAGEWNVSTEIIVGEKVKMKETQQKVVADEKLSVTLHCEARGTPTPVVQWYKNGNPIEASPKYVLETRKNSVYTLQIKNLQHYDADEYTCKATQDRLSYYITKHIQLTVHHKPVMFDPETNIPITERVREVFAVMNAIKNISCTAHAVPPPKFTWSHERAHYESFIPPDMIVMSEDNTTSTLMLRLASDNDLGTYKCSVSNSKGKEEINFDVRKGRKPTPPDQIEFVSSNISHIVFNVTCDECTFTTKDDVVALTSDNLPIDGYSFHLVPHNSDYEAADWDIEGYDIEVDMTDTNSTLFEVGELSNATTFHVRVRSRNAAGYSDWLNMQQKAQTTSHGIQFTFATVLLLATLLAIEF